MVVYANRISKSETDGEGREIEHDNPFLKAYSVFNVEQIDGLGDRYGDGSDGGIVQRIDRIAHADAFFARTGAFVHHGGDKAFYAPGPDLIQMPPIETSRDVESYYATLAHESVHWAGGSHRLNRDLSKYAKDRTERAREELIAELGAAFLAADVCAHTALLLPSWCRQAGSLATLPSGCPTCAAAVQPKQYALCSGF